MPSTKSTAAGRTVARQPERRRVARAAAATPGRRFSMGKRGQGIANFIRELRIEIGKVIWPKRREVVNLTGVIVALSVAMGAVLGVVDYVFQEFFRFVLQGLGVAGY